MVNVINPKSNLEILHRLLREKKLPGVVVYDKNRHGWMYHWKEPLYIGNFVQAIVTITCGTMDFIAEDWANSRKR